MNSSEHRRIASCYGKRLASFSATLVQDMQRSAEAIAPTLTAEEMIAWAEEGIGIARQSWRSWEAASEYFRVTPRMLSLLGKPAFYDWAQEGRGLIEMSSALAVAYYRASPETLSNLPFSHLSGWVELGRQLYKGTWRSTSLAAQLFEGSPELFSRLSLEEARILVRFVDSLCDRSYDLASRCLSVAPESLTPLAGEDRLAFLRFAEALAATGWADARSYLEKGPAMLDGIHPAQRSRLLDLSCRLAQREGKRAFGFFAETAQSLSRVNLEQQPILLMLAQDLAGNSPIAAMEFLKNSPEVLSRIRVEDVERWHAEGMGLLGTSLEGGEAYFRLESSRSEKMLDSLSSQVELARVSHVLRMYCKALTGIDVDVCPADQLAEKGIGWVDIEAPSTEGTSIYLPSFVDDCENKADNFAIYKVYSTHQAGHLEFGSFHFNFERDGSSLPNLRRKLEMEQARESAEVDTGDDDPLTDMGRFFALFTERQLASDLFAILEDTRVDAAIEREYSGIVGVYQLVRLQALAGRPPIAQLPLLQAMLENLVRVSLEGLESVRLPASQSALEGTLKAAISVVQSMRQSGMTVEDVADGTICVYRLLAQVHNQPVKDKDEEWQQLDKENKASNELISESENMVRDASEAGEVPYESPQSVGFRGDFKPELVQLLTRLRDEHGVDGDGERAAMPVSMDQLRGLAERSVEITQIESSDASIDEVTEQLLSNLMKEIDTQGQKRSQGTDVPVQDDQSMSDPSLPGGNYDLESEPRYFYYDEWDFRAGDYKPRWCRVAERVVAEGSTQFFDATLVNYHSLATQTRRQFELLRPELFRKVKGMLDGEEFDLDTVVEYVTERAAGNMPPEKIYWRRNKIERDVSAAFLLDMSASTDEEIARHEQRQDQDEFKDEAQRYFSWWMARRTQDLTVPPKRIIDLEKESIVLLIQAMEAIGDIYGIYGFSGYGREDVEFSIIKDMAEPFSDRIKQRIDKIAPVRSTRMGPAIRHATSKLEACESKVRILFLVSDGRPQDRGYGRDRTENDYAIHDTHMALMEAKRRGIVPFCLTIDRYGHDYLKKMCADIGYAVVADIEALPAKITALYRCLTA